MARPQRWAPAVAAGLMGAALLPLPATANGLDTGHVRDAKSFASQLNAVTAIAPDDVWAVGSQLSSTKFLQRPLVLHGDGTSWHRVPTPGRATVTDTLNAVDADASDDVWAVGAYGSSEVLLEHWDGSRWRRIAGPDLGDATGVALTGVSVVSPSDVWAVGGLLHGFTDGTLVEHRDGTSWSRVHSPARGYLTAVDAVSATDVWAVGIDINDSGNRAVVLHWDGDRWSRVPSHLGSQFTDVSLAGVSAASSDDVWAVGQGLGGNGGTRKAVVAHWDGTVWAPVASFDRPEARTWLQAVSVTSPHDVWAVGAMSGIAGQSTLVEHWDGSHWSKVPSPAPGQVAELRGVHGLDAQHAWAVGDFDRHGATRHLLATWDGSAWRQG